MVYWFASIGFFCEKSTKTLSGTGSVLILNSQESEMISITVLDKHGNKLKRGLGEVTKGYLY